MRRIIRGLFVGVVLLGTLPLGATRAAAADVLVSQFDVFGNDPSGTNSAPLDDTKTYRAEVSGYFLYNTNLAPAQADAECHTVLNNEPMSRFFWDPTLGQGVLDVWVDNKDVEWVPANDLPYGCDDPNLGGAHRYKVNFKPTASGPVRFGVRDNFYGDNFGSMHVKIFELGAPPPPVPTLIPVSFASVDSHDPAGANSFPVANGFTYTVETTGAYTYSGANGDLADSECSRSASDANWVPDRYGLLNSQDWLDLLVNTQSVEWQPQGSGPPGCNTTSSHAYRVSFTPTIPGPVNFRVNDTFNGDNNGLLQVTIYLVVS